MTSVKLTRVGLIIAGVLITPLLIWFAVYFHQSLGPAVLFPYSYYSMGLHRIALPYDSLGAPWLHEVIIAFLQYPLYGIYLAQGPMGNPLRGRIIKLAIIHFVTAILALVSLDLATKYY